NRLGKAHARERGIERWRELDVRYQRATAAGDDEVLPPGKRLAQRFPGTPSHDHRVPGRQGAKPTHILRQAPRQAVLDADDAIARDRGDDRDSMRMGRIRRAW